MHPRQFPGCSMADPAAEIYPEQQQPTTLPGIWGEVIK